ncbi:hypothetical protein EZV62_012959 [Acer yangbiense]|uniref:TF-B3 domain-containing protein n=1 Tax=Acer yangbiense TaxID=1000413 RepID=A0A5C7HZ07_9ROSI|nr:hypothetical protein EZV62_012959 [Acer yangbiense]
MASIFTKPLSKTDVSHRLAIPSKKLNEIATLSLGEKAHIPVIDATGRQWSFLLSTRNEGKFFKQVISGKEWLEFVKKKQLREGDNITLSGDQPKQRGYSPMAIDINNFYTPWQLNVHKWLPNCEMTSTIPP